MAGRPPIPISQKVSQGDTRKLGANKFTESLQGTFEPKRGRPRMPECLKYHKSKSFEGEAAIAKAIRLTSDAARQSILATARKHWSYCADSLEREGKLALMDEGMLTTLALSYAQMVDAGANGHKSFKDLSQRYMQAADRMGLNESARVRIPASPHENEDPLDGALGPRVQTA